MVPAADLRAELDGVSVITSDLVTLACQIDHPIFGAIIGSNQIEQREQLCFHRRNAGLICHASTCIC